MEIVSRVSRMSAICSKITAGDIKVGLISAMGAIHPGHISMIRTARSMADIVVVAIFINRLEPGGDPGHESYPNDFMKDVDLLRQESVDYVFNPPKEEMLPPGFSTFIEVAEFGDKLSGLNHNILFRGMPTTVLKLIQIVRPAFIFMNQKDALQGSVLRKMIRDLDITTELVMTSGGRDSSGLAYGSRYRSLTDVQKTAASVIYRSLAAAETAVAAGEIQTKKLFQLITKEFENEPQVEMEYVVIADPLTLEPLSKLQGQVLIGIGAKVGEISLNDSLFVEIPTK